MSKENRWANPDGLNVGFGTRKVSVNTAGKVSVGGQRQQLVVDIVGNKIPDVDVTEQLQYGAVIPEDALIESAKLFVETAFAGATAVLDIGVYNANTGSAVDDDGIDSAIAVGSLTAGAVINCDGAVIGTLASAPLKVGVTYDTAAFTAGKAKLVIEYIPA